MTNNISGKDHKLGKLLDSVSHDTPDLSHDELLALITKSEERTSAASMRQTTQRKNRGIAVVTTASIVLTVAFLIWKVQTTIRIETHQLKSSSRNQVVKPIYPFEAASKVAGDEQLDKVQLSKHPDISIPSQDPNRRHIVILPPINLEAVDLIQVAPEIYPTLGVSQSDDEEYIYYHKANKVGFPKHDYVRGYWDPDDDSLRTELGSTSFIAEYATDAKGNMMMHYDYRGAAAYSIRFYDRAIENLEENGEFNIDDVTEFNVPPDAINDRRVLSFKVREGIAVFDTILEGHFGDSVSLEAKKADLIRVVKSRDSVTKARYGGPAVIAKQFKLSLLDDTDTLSKQVRQRLAGIASSGKNELQMLEARQFAILSMMDNESSIERKLRLEQLEIALRYETFYAHNRKAATDIAEAASLIPVLIRQARGIKYNPRFDDGLILWYRDSDSLRRVLGMSASIRRSDNPKLKMSVMPNPAMLYLYVNYDLEEAAPLRLTLADITGKQVYTDAWKAGAGSGKKEINVQQFPNGIYMLLLDSDRGRTTRQVIIQHQ